MKNLTLLLLLTGFILNLSTKTNCKKVLSKSSSSSSNEDSSSNQCISKNENDRKSIEHLDIVEKRGKIKIDGDDQENELYNNRYFKYKFL